MKETRQTNHKLLVYQVLPRTFTNACSQNKAYGSIEENGCGKFNDISDNYLEKITALGYTHIWYTGILEHASCEAYPDHGIDADPPETVKGRAGSPYAVRDYYNVCPDLASDINNRLGEFRQLVERSHQHKLKVIIDHVPNHVARNYRSEARDKGLGAHDDKTKPFAPENDFYYLPEKTLKLPDQAYEQAAKQAPELPLRNYREEPAKATGNDRFTAEPGFDDWYETVKLNYGNSPEGEDLGNPGYSLWKKMKDILLFWCEQGVDGFRFDMAGMVPLSYWYWVIREVREEYPEILFIAEIYEPEKYQAYLQAGFDYLYDKVGFYDRIRLVMEKKEPAGSITKIWQEGGGFDHRMLRFLENHDEHRIASTFFCTNPYPGIPAMAAALFMHKGPAMVYAGQEFGEHGDYSEGFSGRDGRSSIFDYWGIESLQRWMNGGRFDGKRLETEQKSLWKKYSALLSIAANSFTVRFGAFFDLQYAQHESEGYDGRKCFSFIRHTEAEALLFILWFSDLQGQQRIGFPSHLFDMAPWLSQRVNIKTIFPKGIGNKENDRLLSEGLEFDLEPWSCQILRISKKDIEN